MGARAHHIPSRALREAPLPSPQFASGTVEAVKWLALALMVLDHVNTFLFHDTYPWAFAAGRTVMPLFSLVLAYNLARGAPGAAWRTARRAAFFGALATPAMWALRGGGYPLNIMFALAAAAVCIGLLEQNRPVVALVFGALAGIFVEFWWPAIGATVAAWYWLRTPSLRTALPWMVCIALLVPINGNAWACAALPILLIAYRLDLAVPRLRWVFYVAYPLHLFILWGLK